ncbi:MAG: glycosyltransferase [Tistlia sp.]|uniref:glycosyltransferase n=1 Tax=Tistlia sp. TaxID=3057121 RepID=UPI0034A36D30
MTSAQPDTAARRGVPLPPYELTVVVPTLNERDNVRALYAALAAALAGESWEVVFVDDDSDDGTPGEVAGLAAEAGNVRLLHRIGRRGLSSAFIEGALSSTAPVIACIDADLQHDERLLPVMLRTIRAGEAEVVLGSRYAAGGGEEGLSGNRKDVSRFGTRLANWLLGSHVSDPLSGFFALDRRTFEATVRRLSGIGFKILVDILASAERPLTMLELPYTFRPRHAGTSKFDSLVGAEYLQLLIDKALRGVVPARFVLFCLVGGIGVGLHLAVLWATHDWLGFAGGQTVATLAAMTSNFFLNNFLTYADRRLKGWRLLWGLASFYAICSVGAVANIGVASFLHGSEGAYWGLAGLAGALVGAVWNFAVSSIVTWRR